MQWLRELLSPKPSSGSPRLVLAPGTWEGLTEDDEEIEGYGFDLYDQAGALVTRQAQGLRSLNIWVVNVAGVSYRPKELQNPAFAPGKKLRLKPDTDNKFDKSAVGIWDSGGRLMIGYVPAAQSAEVKAALRTGLEALSMFEFRKDERRVGLRVLIAPRVDLPRMAHPPVQTS